MSAIGQEGAPNGTSAEQQTAQQPSFDYERGYQELRPEYTRATQELSSTRDRLSEYEQLFEALHDPDPQTQAAAMEALGLEVDTGSQRTQQEEFVDPLEQQLNAAMQRLEQLESARELETSQRESQELVGIRDEYIGEAIGVIEGKLSMKFNEREEAALGNLAIAMPDEQGVPNVEAAYNLLYGNDGVLEINRARWIDSKTGAAQPPLGTTIPAEQRPKTASERIDWIDERVAQINRQQ